MSDKHEGLSRREVLKLAASGSIGAAMGTLALGTLAQSPADDRSRC